MFIVTLHPSSLHSGAFLAHFPCIGALSYPFGGNRQPISCVHGPWAMDFWPFFRLDASYILIPVPRSLNLAALFPHQAPCIYFNPLNLHPVNIDLYTYCTPPLHVHMYTCTNVHLYWTLLLITNPVPLILLDPSVLRTTKVITEAGDAPQYGVVVWSATLKVGILHPSVHVLAPSSSPSSYLATKDFHRA